MAIIPPTPGDINECTIVKILEEKSTSQDGLASKVQDFIAIATPMVDFVSSGPFRHYTLHNRDHAKKILHLTEHIVTPETIAKLSALECTLIIYSAFLHDMGMAITQSERETILKSTDYQDSLRAWPAINSALHTRTSIKNASIQDKPVLEALIYQLHECALTAFLRPHHATPERYRKLIDHLMRSSGNPELFSLKGISFDEYLIDICVSHNLDAAILSEPKSAHEDRYPRDVTISHEQANTQFCAAVLRLTDILDFDRERTPKVLFDSLGLPDSNIPGTEVSVKEWEKHLAVHTLEIRSDEITVSAECRHPAIERSINDFCSIIEREIKDTAAVLNRNPYPTQEKYRINLPLSVRPRISSKGYIYRDLALRLNQSAIISLLMGEKLYTNSSVAIRELLQNSLDACSVRLCIEQKDKYIPKIMVTNRVDERNRTWIEVSDNGIGMDEHFIGEYFLKLGDSYYDSPEFMRQIALLSGLSAPFKSISKFGIGILSVFMLADVLEVQTKSAFSARKDFDPRFIRIERLGGIVFIAPGNRNSSGTTVRIRLRQDINAVDVIKGIIAYLRRLLIRPSFFIRVALGNDDRHFYLPLPSGEFYTAPIGKIDKLRKRGFEVIAIDLSRWSRKLSGIIALVFKIDSRGRLSNVVEDKQIRLHENPAIGTIDPNEVLSNFRGNRISVNGFRLSSFRIRNILALGEKMRLSFLIDMDVKPDDKIEYDVSRERLTKSGERHLRDEISMAVTNALNQTGVIEKMLPELAVPLLATLEKFAEYSTEGEIYNDAPDALYSIFNIVQENIPHDHWPKGMHRKLAEKVGISPSLAAKVINRLISRGLISNPNN